MRLLRKGRRRSAPINRVFRFDGRHEQRLYSLGRIDTRITKRRQRHDSCCRRIVVQVGGFGEGYSEATRWLFDAVDSIPPDGPLSQYVKPRNNRPSVQLFHAGLVGVSAGNSSGIAVVRIT